jgi:aspartate kinase
MQYIVQKFGGTSLGKAERMRSVADIVRSSLAHDRIIVALSAMSSYVKAEGTTSRLIEAADAALNRRDFYRIIDQLEDYHLDTTRALIAEPFQEQVVEQVNAELKSLKSFLEAINVIGEISPRSHDVIISTGEKLSALIFTGLLNSTGVDAEYVNLDALIDKPFAEANHEFYAYTRAGLKKRIELCGHRVPVLTGYFGFVPGGIIHSIGRGYTDLTAALAAAAMGARELQIWKEVDGVFSADPRKVEDAHVLESITPDEAAELTYYGSEVIHPFTMEQVIRANIPIRIKNTLNPSVPGTIVDPNLTDTGTSRPATAVTAKRNVTVINIASNRMLMAYGFMARVFNVFEKYGIVIDLIATSEVSISMTLDSEKNFDRAIADLQELGEVTVRRGLAILSLVGRGQKNCMGLAGRMFSELGNEKINIEMISQGASEINVSCVIEDEHADRALRVIHSALVR